MKFLGAYATAGDDRRIRNVQALLWFACLGPALAFGFIVMEIGFGHPDQFALLTARPMRAVIACGWLVLFGVAAALVGARRAMGAILGLVLFSSIILMAAIEGQLLTLPAAYSILGIVVILRAGKALHIPFVSPR